MCQGGLGGGKGLEGKWRTYDLQVPPSRAAFLGLFVGCPMLVCALGLLVWIGVPCFAMLGSGCPSLRLCVCQSLGKEAKENFLQLLER